MQEQLRHDIEAVERQEQEKYERKVEAMRREVAAQASALNVEAELQQYKDLLVEEFEIQVREYRKLLEQQAAAEEEKMERKRARELKEYEALLQE
jgi:hypothetical protein